MVEKEIPEKSLVVFQSKKIRRTWYNHEWWFSIVDIVSALTDSSDPKQYIKKMRARDESLNDNWSTICTPLELTAPDGKKRQTNCVNVKGAFRVIQSIPSKKAEPFKRWLAKVGYERIQEIENPELAQDRAKEYYELKGYPKNWIDKRLRSIAIREELTEEWKNRGIEEKKDYAILTNEISKATFGVGIKEHKQIKELDPKFQNQNLRDHMTDLELIFNMLGEKVSTEITKNKDSQGVDECKDAAKQGGNVAGNARRDAEKHIGKPITTRENYKKLSETQEKQCFSGPKKSKRFFRGKRKKLIHSK